MIKTFTIDTDLVDRYGLMETIIYGYALEKINASEDKKATIVYTHAVKELGIIHNRQTLRYYFDKLVNLRLLKREPTTWHGWDAWNFEKGEKAIEA